MSGSSQRVYTVASNVLLKSCPGKARLCTRHFFKGPRIKTQKLYKSFLKGGSPSETFFESRNPILSDER